MTRQFSWLALAGAMALATPVCTLATTYYVNDASTNNDVFCRVAGNSDFNGLTPATPKLHLTEVAPLLVGGDTVFIDTGEYAVQEDNKISFSGTNVVELIGSTNGTCLYGEKYLLYVNSSQAPIVISNLTLRITSSSQYSGQPLHVRYSTVKLYNVRLIAPAVAAFSSFGRIDVSFENSLLSGTAAYVNSYGSAGSVSFSNCTLVAKNEIIGTGGLSITLLNSILTTTSGPVFFRCDLANIAGKHNLFFSPFGLDRRLPGGLKEFESIYTNLTDSAWGNPGFISIGDEDFHLSSPNGHFVEHTTGYGIVTGREWKVDASLPYSPAIDAGDDVVGAEPDPNGGRRNLGAYGGTEQASKSRPAGEKWLQVCSCNDGAAIVGGVALKWNCGNFGVSDNVRVQLSTDGGLHWTTLATVKAINASYDWTVTAAQASPQCLWRVQSTDGAVVSQCEPLFSARPSLDTHFTFYVNDGSTDGDKFCSEVGNDENAGWSTNMPKRTIQAVLNTYHLYAGDQILVDTGNYDEEAPVVIGTYDSGISGAPVVLRGAGCDTILARGNSSWDVLQANSASWLTIKDMVLSGGRYGFYDNASANIVLENVEVVSNSTAIFIEDSGATNIFLNRMSIHDNKYGINASTRSPKNVVVSNSVLWNNPTALNGTPTSLEVSHSIIGGDAACTLLGASTYPSGDFNVLKVSKVSGSIPDLAEFQSVQTNWQHSVVMDPLFVDAANGDFHLKSEIGHASISGGITNWVADEVHSPAIDFGATWAPFANEPTPNGGRANVGLYGNTKEASKSRTNAWIQILSFNDGGTLNAQSGSTIRWNAGSLPTGAKLTLWLSRDNGATWEQLKTGISAASGSYFYQKPTAENKSSLNAYLKLTLESDEAVATTNATTIAFRDGAFSFYVNDASQVGDVYCKGIGANGEGRGLNPEAPLASLQQVLSQYQLAQGDVVYVDTGNYSDRTPITFKQFKVNTNSIVPFVRVLGSTNFVAGGTVVGSRSSRQALAMTIPATVSNLVVQDIVFTNWQKAIVVSNAVNIQLRGVQVRGASTTGIEVGRLSENVEILQSVLTGCEIGVSLASGSTNTVLDHNVFWKNTVGLATASGAGATLKNSILGASALGSRLYQLTPGHSLLADHNGLFADGDAVVGCIGANNDAMVSYDNFHAWLGGAGLDEHSIPGDPMMADSEAFDYHLMTERTLGRYLPNGQRTTDELSSPLLNEGDDGENLGIWGGTSRASIAPDKARLNVWSFSDQGEVKAGEVPLRWGASREMSNDTVTVEVSVDGGRTWSQVANHVAATNGMVLWDTTGLPDTPSAMWRVTSESDKMVTDDNGCFFAIRNEPLKLYLALETVDTNSTTYVTAPGAGDNWKASRDAPLNSLKAALDAFDLEPGDTIFMDKGVFSETETTAITYKDSGSRAAPVSICGVTNRSFEGTSLQLEVRGYASQLLSVNGANNIKFEAIGLSNAWSGVQIQNATGISFAWTKFGHFVTNSVFAGRASETKLEHVVMEDSTFNGIVAFTGAVVNVNHAYLRDNMRYSFALEGGTLALSNSVVEASGQGHSIYHVESATGNLYSDNNCLRALNAAAIAIHANGTSDRFLYDWQTSQGGANDMVSFGYDPQMVDPESGDYHLKSEFGRFEKDGEPWAKDGTTSRLIDMGAGDYAEEQPPNGNRANVGPYGNSVEASLSSGKAEIIPLTMSDGGTMRGDVTLFWGWNGLAGTNLVNVLFSGDGGKTWTNTIASGIYLNWGAKGLAWSTTNVMSTAMGMWRVETTDGKVVGTTETLFAIRNAALKYYVNDGATNGDVYCTTVGSPQNDGLAPDSPMDSLERLFGRYKLDVGDTVYVDTGVYVRDGTLTLVPGITATTNNLVIQGSTNALAGGTVFTNSASSNAVLVLSGAESLELRNITLKGGSTGMRLASASHNKFWHIQSDGAMADAFDLSVDSNDNLFEECAAIEFCGNGFLVEPIRDAQHQFPVTNAWIGGVMLSKGMNPTNSSLPITTSTFVVVTSGKLRITNSVFQANGAKDVVYSASEGTIDADYNAYELGQPGIKMTELQRSPAPLFGLQKKAFETLDAWRQATGLDEHSFAGAVLLADVANRDFHPLSPAGRYDMASGVVMTNDDQLSPLVGTGYGDVNMGWFGRGTEASRKPSALECVLLTFNDGGLASGMEELRWKCQGGTGSEMVQVFISTNRGERWEQMGRSVAASTGAMSWDTTEWSSGALTRWQLRSGGRTLATSEKVFVIHNGGLSYYVNDGAMGGEAWCTAAGDDGNSGFSPSKPKATLASLLKDCALAAGDTIFIDAGTYVMDEPVEIGFLDSGTAEVPVRFQGAPHGATVFHGAPLTIANAVGIEIEDIVFRDSVRNGVVLKQAESLALKKVDVLNAAWSALSVSGCSNVLARNVLLAGSATNGLVSEASYGLFVDQATISGNKKGAVSAARYVQGKINPNLNVSFVAISNSILTASGIRVPIYSGDCTIYGNYNDLYTEEGALVALVNDAKLTREIGSVNGWFNECGQESASLSHNPQFVDFRRGNYHLMSEAGHWTEAGTYSDASTSAVLDAGNPDREVGDEPAPNGGRLNLGRYGGTDEASMTPAMGSLILISLNDGGKASGTEFPITWLARGAATNTTLRIEYWNAATSNWITLASNVTASASSWAWDTTQVQPSVQGRLRLTASDGTTVENNNYFSVRNQGDTFMFYINDASQEGDQYTKAKGDNTADGLSPLTPMADLNRLLEKYDLDAGDTVYIDTGNYRPGASPWQITQADTAGDMELAPVVIQGPTNTLNGGAVLDRQGYPRGIVVNYGAGLELRNICVSNALETAFSVDTSYGVKLWGDVARNVGTGFTISGGSGVRLAHSLVYHANVGASVTTAGQMETNAIDPVVEHSVFWNIQGSSLAMTGGRSVTARHNVYTTSRDSYAYSVNYMTTIHSDYNCFALKPGDRVMQRAYPVTVQLVPDIFDTVGAWATGSGNDTHSYDGDPLFVNPDELDFHLQSTEGQYSLVTKKWTNGIADSPLIDAGEENMDVGEEPAPNGGRRNIGLYGGTSQASKSAAAGRFVLLAYNNGGYASGRVSLTWNALGAATGATVKVEVSSDDGASWESIGSQIDAGIGGILWNSTSFASGPLYRWRVVDESGRYASAMSVSPFVLHNMGIAYYVNDDTLDERGYCTALGLSENDGLTPATPKRWLSEIVETYHLGAGDIVYVDGGHYQIETPIAFQELDSGKASRREGDCLRIQGQTNSLAQKTVFINPTAEGSIFQFNGAYGIRLCDIETIGASNSVGITGGYFIDFDGFRAKDASIGILCSAVSNVNITHSAIVGMKDAAIDFSGSGVMLQDFRLNSSVLWSNHYGVHLRSGTAYVSNSVISSLNSGDFAYYIHIDKANHKIDADYNSIYVEGGMAAGLQSGNNNSARTTLYSRVSAWATEQNQDVHSLTQNPLFVDAGAGDFHLKSVQGYRAGTNWAYADRSSTLIDAGTPGGTVWTVEPTPNGRRLNIGIYGGTAEASKSPQAGWLTPLTLVDGGAGAGLIELAWQTGGAATNDTVCLEYSPDNGVTWQPIECGWPAEKESYTWDSETFGSSALGLWRIYSERDPAIIGETMSPFVLRNGGSIAYYVNDSWDEGDIYCTAEGNDANDGLTPGTPKATVQAILDAYDLADADVVYVDSGFYRAGSPPITIDGTDSGNTNIQAFVVIQGSTNPVAQTVFHGANSDPCVFNLAYAENVKLRNLVIENAQAGVQMTMCRGCSLEDVTLRENRAYGLTLDRSERTRVIRSLLWKNFSQTGGVAVAVGQGSDVTLLNSILWGSRTAVHSFQGGAVNLTNSVLQARGADGRIYDFENTSTLTNLVHADYNVYRRRDGAILAEQAYLAGGSDLYNDFAQWMSAIGGDRHSFAMDPDFVDSGDDGGDAGDFHLRSPAGSFSTNNWDPNGNHWITYWTQSPLIDAGDPAMDVGDEPEPNGGVVNIGIYGGTEYASKTPTNRPWVRALSFNEECVITTNALLYWNYGGLRPDTPVTLQYTLDNVNWFTIVSNVPVSVREYEWNVTDLPLTVSMKWRIDASGLASDMSDVAVSVKTRTYSYYINDSSREGDVYCKATGMEWRDEEEIGQRPERPLSSLIDLFKHYPVGAGDIIFIDTGVYSLGTNVWTIGNANAGMDAFPLAIVGSTNWLAGGSVISGTENVNGVVLLNTHNIVVSNLNLTGMMNGIVLNNVSDVMLKGMDIRENAENGVLAQNAADLLVENSVIAKNGSIGICYTGSSAGTRQINHCTLVDNRIVAVETDKGFSISNSIVAATNDAACGIRLPSIASQASGDFNLYWLPGGLLANEVVSKSSYTSIRQWQDKAGEEHSFAVNPQFADAAAGDYHLLSRGGYWSNGVWRTADVTSWGIDAADPEDLSYAREPSPNGTRANVGAYGGTPQAAASDTTTPALFAMSLNDGGVAPAGQILHWLWHGIAGGTRANLRYSPDGGETWKLISETTVGQGNTGFEWLSDWTPSPLALWKIELVSDSSIADVTDSAFVFRPSPLIYYVNDEETEGDVYTTAIGSVSNNGYQDSSPMESIEHVLASYQLTPEDSILVDSGVYNIDQVIEISGLNSGNIGKLVRIVGSTNTAYPSVLVGPENSTNAAISFNRVHDFELANLHFVGFKSGVSIPQQCARIFLTDDVFELMDANAVSSSLSQDIMLSRVLVRDGLGDGFSFSSASGVAIDGCVVWGNGGNAISMANSQVTISNSVLSASGFGSYCYLVSTGEVAKADYNDLVLFNSAQVASINGQQYERVPQWVVGTGQDRHSLAVDPLFVDVDNGDFHLRSLIGRYDPFQKKWVQDAHEEGKADFSPLIDMGSPLSTWSNEPAPNGKRRNIGLYGDTWQASKGDTNAWVKAITAMSGGLLQGTFFLTWGYGGEINSNEWVRLEYSPFNGEGDWYYIATNRIGSESFFWVSAQKMPGGGEQWTTSPEAQWRVVLLSDTNVWNATEAFGLRNRPFSYYVNDESQTGDVYTTVIGSNTASGFWPNKPKLTLQSLLEEVDLEPTDEVYLDTGVYYMWDTNNPVVWQVSDGGTPGANVRLIGSTNSAGSVFVVSNQFSTGYVFDLNSQNVEVRDIALENRIPGNRGMTVLMSGNGLDVGRIRLSKATLRLNSSSSTYSNLTVSGGTVSLAGTSNRVTRMEANGGEVTISGDAALLDNSVVYVAGSGATAVTVRASASAISNSTIVSKSGTAVSKSDTGLLTLANNILQAGGTGAAINWISGTLRSDYNDLYAPGEKAWIGIVNDEKWERLAYWQKASGVDAHSISANPKFANEEGDFHLQSMAENGRYDPKYHLWRRDSGHSPAIDMANPLLTAGAELLPNGARRNLGAYGGTEEGSRSITNFWVQAVSLNDGGVVKGTNVSLRWSQNRQAGLGAQTVRLEYSQDGRNWTTIATGLSANNGVGTYQWDTTAFDDSFTAFWRVVSESDDSISDETDVAFNLRNNVADFYVSTEGGDENDGRSAETPMRNIQALLNRYDLEGGDIVHIASGTYANDTNIEVIWSRSGSEADGDILIDGDKDVTIEAGTPAITIHSDYLEWNGAKLSANSTNNTTGVVVDGGTGVTLSEMDFEGQTVGVDSKDARYLTVRNSSFWKTGIGVNLATSRHNTLENLTFIDLPIGIKLGLGSDDNVLRNNIFAPSESGKAYDIGTAVDLLSDSFMDYNIYDMGATDSYILGPENSALFEGTTNDLRQWQLTMHNDYRSMMGPAGLANAGRGDFHALSPYGRWDGSQFVKDTELSFAVDHGDPTMEVGDEVPDNGARINIGRFGGLAEASKGSTNIALGIRTLNTEGQKISSLDATWPLVWDAHLVPEDTIVYVQFSGNGIDWQTLCTTNAYAECYVWTITTAQQTDLGRWRVISKEGELVATSTNTFEYTVADLGFKTPPYRYHGLMRFKWEGGLVGKRHIIMYSDDFGQTWQMWPAEYNGPEKMHRSNFVMQPGDAAVDYTFEDVTSFGKPQRWYRLLRLDDPSPEGSETPESGE